MKTTVFFDDAMGDTLMLVTVSTFETSVNYQTTRSNISEDSHLHFTPLHTPLHRSLFLLRSSPLFIVDNFLQDSKLIFVCTFHLFVLAIYPTDVAFIPTPKRGRVKCEDLVDQRYSEITLSQKKKRFPLMLLFYAWYCSHLARSSQQLYNQSSASRIHLKLR
jgi:hypothetical protein